MILDTPTSVRNPDPMRPETGRINLDIEGITLEQTLKYQEILTALIASGALNIRNGKAVLHFDHANEFQGVVLEYWAVKKRRQP